MESLNINKHSIQHFSILSIFAEKLWNHTNLRLRIRMNVHNKMHKMHYSWGKFTIQDQYLRLLYTSLIGRGYIFLDAQVNLFEYAWVIICTSSFKIFISCIISYKEKFQHYMILEKVTENISTRKNGTINHPGNEFNLKITLDSKIYWRLKQTRQSF